MRKKICFIVATPNFANIYLKKHFEYLSKDYDIYLVSNFKGYSSFYSSFTFIKGVKDLDFERKISIFKDVKALNSLRRYFKEIQFDAIHSATPKAGLIGVLAAKLAGIKIRTHIFTGQVWYTKQGWFKMLLKNIDRFIVFCATDILVDGLSQRQFLIDNGIIKESNSQVLGKGSISGVDVEKFIPNSEIAAVYRKKFNFKDEFVFMFLGRLNIDKGLLDLAAAFLKLNSKYPNTRLVFVGPDEEMMQQKIEKIGSKCPSIVFSGATTAPQDVLQMADVFCLPSYREGFGSSIIEASLLEKPIICSDTYGVKDAIIENETGFRHKVKDLDSIFEQMEKLMDQEVRETMGKNGRAYVLHNFSAELISLEWLNYYKNKLA
ncbi:glycosyltransferase family 4 protein [Flavobacterium franklandianum]|uniref:Glycosyltransferase family 4 protein n=1 Tax=Flavobacterium franklandianum TaxID=2594430 RepID=A0A553CK48_9FLAO|nr:glycosyltransferase family 4 protein [Flavobacterium franklandianum]TRX20873.1 glycosyltransferase family 4 protein [Flavobacterium franklandianum]TRX29453.1 glycosyltransferase family 4 protein [Flavobacterium franklandianum]